MVPVNLDTASVRRDGKEVYVRFVFVIQDVRHMECALMELAFAQMVIIHRSIYSISNNFDFIDYTIA